MLTTNELLATGQALQRVRGKCDWLLQNFDLGKEARTGEVETLGRAMAVLWVPTTPSFRSVPRLSQRYRAKGWHNLEVNFYKIAPFGKEDTARELQDQATETLDTLVDAVENPKVVPPPGCPHKRRHAEGGHRRVQLQRGRH